MVDAVKNAVLEKHGKVCPESEQLGIYFFYPHKDVNHSLPRISYIRRVVYLPKTLQSRGV